MGNISTGTVCPFPFTFANASDDTLASCTKTYGEALDPALLIFQVVIILFFGAFGLPVMFLRMYKLRQFARETKTRYWASTQSKLYINAVILCLCVVIEMIDPLGYRNLITPYLYFVLDEFAASSLLLLALFMVDFYLTTAHRASFKDGLPLPLLLTCIFLTYVNFVGFQVAGMYLPHLYAIFEAMKLIGAFILLTIFAVISYRARRDILEVLTRSEPSGDTSLRAAMRWRYPESTSVGVRTVLVTKRKFCEWFTTVFIGGIFLIAAALLSFGVFDEEVDYTWEYKVEESPEAPFFAFKGIYAIALILILRTFHVPKVGSSRGGSLGSKGRTESKSELTKKTNFNTSKGSMNASTRFEETML